VTGSPKPHFRDNLKDYKYEIPGGKEKKKFECPETHDVHSYGTSNDHPGDVDSRKFGNWWLSHPGAMCQLQMVAEGWQTFFLAFEPHVTYTAAENTDALSVYVPSQPHPKGFPVALVDSRTFLLSAKTAKTFVPSHPQTQKEMLQAMKSGKVMIVKWIDEDGTRREDRYSLSGFSLAHSELALRCP
jgi:hypothetical protein